MDKAHGVDGVQRHDNLCSVELGPLLRDVVVTHEVDEVSTGHVVHHHVQVAVVLERIVQLVERYTSGKSTGHEVLNVRKRMSAYYPV